MPSPMHQYDTQVWPLDEDAVKLIPAIERVREELFRRWPASEEYVRRTYPDAVNRAAGDEQQS
jgi:hypothetical protein